MSLVPRSFTVQYSETEYVTRQELSYLEHKKGEPLVFTVFERDPSQFGTFDLMASRTVLFPHPVFTR